MSNINKRLGIQPKVRGELSLRDKAYSGDIAWVVNPSTVASDTTEVAWTRTVLVELQTAAGEVHTWYSGTTGNTIADTSTPVPTIVSTDLVIVDGKAIVVITGPTGSYGNDETNTYSVSEATILGYTISEVTSVETFTTPS